MRRRAALIRLGLIVLVVAALEIACRTGAISSFTMVPPSRWVTGMVTALQRLGPQVLRTLAAIVASTVLSVALGTLIGAGLNASPRLRRALDPYLASYYAVPIFVFYPVLVAIFGLTLVPVVLIGFLSAVVSMITALLNGLDRVPRAYLKTARILGLGWAEAQRRVVLPAALPHLLTGVKFALSYSFVGVIGAEFILASQGLGYQISLSFNNFDNPTMYGLILFVLLLVGLVNGALSALEHRVLARRGLAG